MVPLFRRRDPSRRGGVIFEWQPMARLVGCAATPLAPRRTTGPTKFRGAVARSTVQMESLP